MANYEQARAFIAAHKDQTIAEVFGPMMFADDGLPFNLPTSGGRGKLFGVPCFFPDGNKKVGEIVLMTPEQQADFDWNLSLYGNAYATIRRQEGVRHVSEVTVAP